MRPEQILYGVKDFKRICLEDRYYVDKTAFIRRMDMDSLICDYVGKAKEVR